MGSAAFSDSGWDGYFTITSQNAQVDEAVGDICYDLSQAPASFWSSVESDGRSVRVVNSAGDTAYSFELVDFDSVGETGWVFFDCSDDIATGSNVTWRIYAGNSGASLPGVSDTLGRNNVWQTGTLGILHMEEDPSGSAPQMLDSTGNGYSGTSSGTMTTGDLVSGQIGNGIDFDGSNDCIAVNGVATPLQSESSWSVMFWASAASSLSDKCAFGMSASGSAGTAFVFYPFDTASSGGFRIYYNGANFMSDTTSRTGFHHFAYRANSGTDHHVLVDGSSVATSAGSKTVASGLNSVNIGAWTTSLQSFQGPVDEVRINSDPRSDNWVSTHYNAQFANSSFWATGSWSAVGGADTITATDVTATASITAPSLTIGALTIAGVTASAAATATEPSFTIGDPSTVVPSLSGTGTVVEPSVTAGAISITAPSMEATASVVEPSYTTLITTPTSDATGSIVAASVTAGDPNIAPGAAAATGSILAASFVLGDPSTQPGTASGTGTSVAPSVTAGALSLSPGTPLGTASALAASVVIAALSLSAPALSGTATAAEPSLVSTYAISAPTATATGTIAAPSATAGGISVSVGALSATATVAAPSLSGDFPTIVLVLSAVQIYVPGVKAAQIIGGGF